MTSITLGGMVILSGNSLDVCAENFSLALSRETDGVELLLDKKKTAGILQLFFIKKMKLKLNH